MKTTSAEHGQNMFCACTFHGNSMNNLLSYCGLIDVKIRASDKDLPVMQFFEKNKILPFDLSDVQVNLCQKVLFLHKLTHNMTTDCSWNYHENYKDRTCSALVVFMVIP